MCDCNKKSPVDTTAYTTNQFGEIEFNVDILPKEDVPHPNLGDVYSYLNDIWTVFESSRKESDTLENRVLELFERVENLDGSIPGYTPVESWVRDQLEENLVALYKSAHEVITRAELLEHVVGRIKHNTRKLIDSVNYFHSDWEDDVEVLTAVSENGTVTLDRKYYELLLDASLKYTDSILTNVKKNHTDR